VSCLIELSLVAFQTYSHAVETAKQSTKIDTLSVNSANQIETLQSTRSLLQSLPTELRSEFREELQAIFASSREGARTGTELPITRKTEIRTQVAIQAISDTVKQASQASIRPLTTAQLNLLGFGASELAKSIRGEFDSKQAEILQKAEGEDKIKAEELIRQGMNPDKAQARMNTNLLPAWAEAARAVKADHYDGIDAIINIRKSNPSGSLPNNVASALNNVESTCSAFLYSYNVDDCTGALDSLALEAKQ
jgi:hypothetical protein